MIKRCVLCDEKFDQAKRVGGVPYCEKHMYRDIGRYTFYPSEKGGKIKGYENRQKKS